MTYSVHQKTEVLLLPIPEFWHCIYSKETTSLQGGVIV